MPAATGVAVMMPVMMPAAAGVLVLVTVTLAVIAAALMLVFVFMLMLVLVLVFVLMLMFAAAFAVRMMMLVRVAAFAVLVLMLVMMLVFLMFAHKNLRKIQWLLKCSTIGSKENARLFAQMIETEVQDLFDVLVGEGIEHVLPFAAKLDEVA